MDPYQLRLSCLIYVFTVSELRLKTRFPTYLWAKMTDSSSVTGTNTSAATLIHMFIITSAIGITLIISE